MGAFNPLSSLFTVPDSYGAYIGLGGLDDQSMVEAGVRATTSDFSNFDVGLVLSVGVGVGR